MVEAMMTLFMAGSECVDWGSPSLNAAELPAAAHEFARDYSKVTCRMVLQYVTELTTVSLDSWARSVWNDFFCV